MLRMNLTKISLNFNKNSVFEKTVENVTNHRDIKLVSSEKRRKRLVSEPNYHSCRKFPDHLMAKAIKRQE